MSDLNGFNGRGKRPALTPQEYDNLAKVRRTGRKNIRLDDKRAVRANKEGGGNATARLTVNLEKSINKPIKCKGKEWYLYEGGKWQLIDGGKDRYKPKAWDVQEVANRNPRRTKELLESVEQKHQLIEGEEFVGAIRYKLGDKDYLLNFSNCVLKIDVRTGEIIEMLEPKAEYMFTLSLGKYYTGIDCPFFIEVLRQVLDRMEDRKLLLDFFTSTLLPDSRFETALFCLGNGSNGKSVITEVLAEAIGVDVRSSLTLHQICMNDRKHVHRLKDKLINVSTETANKVIEENSIFKMIVSGETIETEQIYREGFSMKSFVKLCFLMNHAPMFKSGTEAEHRRTRFIQFSKRFDEDNRDLLLREKLGAEKEGILSYLVRRLPRLCKSTEMRKGSYISQRVSRTFRTSNDIVSTFLDQCMEKVPNSNTSKPQMYMVFKAFCREREVNFSLTDRQFFGQVRKKYPEISLEGRINVSKTIRHYSCKGLQFSDYGWELFLKNTSKLGKTEGGTRL